MDVCSLLHFKPATCDLKEVSKLFFVCHPEDFELYFEAVTDELLAVTSEEAIAATVAYVQPQDIEHVTRDIIAEMSMAVVVVTRRLLCEDNAATMHVLKLLSEWHIPLLPLIQEPQLGELYTARFGNTQFLDKTAVDTTALPYETKLTSFIKATLVENEMRERIRQAFDAYIFLSYRKKDRACAQEIMRRIHEQPFCRDMAIWYDEYLVPGEDFTVAIQKAIQKSDLFAMVITPHMVEPDNYVVRHEYPMAKQAEKEILPICYTPTDAQRLRSLFEDISDGVDVNDPSAFSESLRRSLKAVALQKSPASPLHNYLIGLAYLTGVDVEIHRERALELITDAAQSGLIEAIGKLTDIYYFGIGCPIDYRQSLLWSETLIEAYDRRGACVSEEDEVRRLTAYHRCASLYVSLMDLEKAAVTAEKAMVLSEEYAKRSPSVFAAQMTVMLFMLHVSARKPSQTAEETIDAWQEGLRLLDELEEGLSVNGKTHLRRLRGVLYAELVEAFLHAHRTDKAIECWQAATELLCADSEDEKQQLRRMKALMAFMTQDDLTEEQQSKTVLELLHLCAAMPITQNTALGYIYTVYKTVISGIAERRDDETEASLRRCVHNALNAYDVLPKRYHTQMLLHIRYALLRAAIETEERLGEAATALMLRERLVAFAEELYARGAGQDTRRLVRQARMEQMLPMMRCADWNKAYSCIEQAKAIAEDCVKAPEATEEDYTAYGLVLSVLSEYYDMTGDRDRALECATHALKNAVWVRRRFNTTTALHAVACRCVDCAEKLHSYGMETEAAARGFDARALLRTLVFETDKTDESMWHEDVRMLLKNELFLGDVFAADGKTDEAYTQYSGFAEKASAFPELLGDVGRATYALINRRLEDGDTQAALVLCRAFMELAEGRAKTAEERAYTAAIRLKRYECLGTSDTDDVRNAKASFAALMTECPSDVFVQEGYRIACALLEETGADDIG